jgi:pyruvate, water dikinase
LLALIGQEPVLAALRQIWDSARSPGATVSRRRLGVLGDLLAAAVIQRLIPADAAGVLFTRDPVWGSEECFNVEASWGLGESVVAGRVTSDSLRITREGEVLAQTTRAKTKAVRFDAAGGAAKVPITNATL